MSLKNRFKQQPTGLQDKVLNFLKKQSYSIIVGEAGSSKDWICLFYALNALYNKEITKIIISKPLVEVGASIGYLTGSLEDKFMPYAESMIEIIQGLLGHAEAAKLINAKQIVFKPLQFIRGSTYDDCCIILSEAQNATLHQLITLMTRKGSNAKIFLNGDLLQADIPNSGLETLVNILKIPEVGFMELGEEYQMREKTITMINRLYRKHLEENPPYKKRGKR